MKCTECGNAMTKSIGDHQYAESGLEHVTLRNVTKYTCESCGARRVNIFAIDSLHKTLARTFANKPARLIPSEVRFLRDYLDLTNKDFAELMGVSPEQTSRWTKSDPIGVPAERFLRMLAIMGPEALAARASDTDQMLEVRIEAVELLRALTHLPPAGAESSELPIKLHRSAKDTWKADPFVGAPN